MGLSITQLMEHLKSGLEVTHCQHKYGYVSLIETDGNGAVLFKLYCGCDIHLCAKQEADRLCHQSRERAIMLLRATNQESGSETDQPGAIRAGLIIVAFAGSGSDRKDEALTFWLAYMFGWLTGKEARRIARKGGNGMALNYLTDKILNQTS